MFDAEFAQLHLGVIRFRRDTLKRWRKHGVRTLEDYGAFDCQVTASTPF
jgi:hypothetical protein